MTTEKPAAGRRRLSGVILVVSAWLGGCATPGPLHVYTLADADREMVRDLGPTARASTPSFWKDDERVSGFAYDPFTDHFFLRLEPGDRIRVVDRPARAIKREFTIAGAPGTGGGDLAVRPRDGHLFLLHPREPAALQTTRFGRLLRTIPLAGLTAPARGIALDPRTNQLLVLQHDGRTISRHAAGRGDPAGPPIVLERPVGASLAFAPETGEFHAPLPDEAGMIGVFDVSGKLLRRLDIHGRFVDLGQRSLVRVF